MQRWTNHAVSVSQGSDDVHKEQQQQQVLQLQLQQQERQQQPQQQRRGLIVSKCKTRTALLLSKI